MVCYGLHLNYVKGCKMADNENAPTDQSKIECSLLLLRLGVFIVMFAWTVEKFTNPAHATFVFDKFYFLDGFGSQVIMVLGTIEMLIILAFLAGMWKRYTYGFIMILHGVSTFSAWQKYTTDINMLFFAAWPMLAACIALYMLRDMDVKFTYKSKLQV